MKVLGRVRWAIAGAGVLGLVAASGIAYATIPDGQGRIHGCYDEQSGQVRIYDPAGGLIKDCGKNEIAIFWNQTGPQGPPGPQGPQGPVGPSEALVATPSFTPFGSGFVTLASLTLPTGNNYIVTAKVQVANPDTTNADSLVCRLTTPSSFSGIDQGTAPAPASIALGNGSILQSWTSVALLTPFQPTSSNQQISLRCVAGFGRVTLYPDQVKLIALRVGSIQ